MKYAVERSFHQWQGIILPSTWLVFVLDDWPRSVADIYLCVDRVRNLGMIEGPHFHYESQCHCKIVKQLYSLRILIRMPVAIQAHP